MLDKTGTIRKGEPVVTDIVTAEKYQVNEILQLVASAEKGSEHPLGEAIVKKAKENELEFADSADFNAIPGHGIEAVISKKNLLLGNTKLMIDRSISLSDLEQKAAALSGEGKTPMWVAIDESIAGIIAVADTVKENSRSATAGLETI